MHTGILKTALAIIIMAALPMLSCSPQEENPQDRFAEIITARAAESGVSRADPGYMQYLEKQSLTSGAARLTQMVSGSNFIWRRPSSAPRPYDITSRSSVWLYINPHGLQTPGRGSVLAHLASPALWSSLNESGITGLYIAPTGAGASLWDNDPKRSLGVNDDTVQYSFARNMGTEQEYARIIERSRAHKVLLGGDITPAATGIGPDFFLAVRNMREFPGLYCLIEVPKHLWHYLPAVRRDDADMQVYELDAAQIDSLGREKLFPPRLAQDAFKPVLKSGWAATGEVRGHDGNLRRWVYRYAYDYKRPILNFNDPSNAARQVMSGSIIFQSGILGNSLNAYRLAPLIGLDPAGANSAGIYDGSNFALFMGMANDLARQSRIYGSHAWLKDELPMPLLRQAMQNGPDLVHDSVLSPAAEHALLTGDASLLNFMADEAVNFEIDWSRLVHAGAAHEGINYALPHLVYMANLPAHGNIHPARLETARSLLHNVPEQAREAAAQGREINSSLFENGRVYTTPAGLAALALGMDHNTQPAASSTGKIRQGHMLLQFFKAMQPGVYMLAGQDITGAMPIEMRNENDERLNEKRLVPMGGYALLSSAESGLNGNIGLPRAKTIYGSMDAQLYDPSSFLRQLSEMIKLRESLKIAEGTVIGRLKADGEGVVALVTRLPDSNRVATRAGSRVYAVSVVNFNRAESAEYFDFSEIPELAPIINNAGVGILQDDFLSVNRQQNTLFVMAPGWSKGLVLIEEGGGDFKRDAAADDMEEYYRPDIRLIEKTVPAAAPAQEWDDNEPLENEYTDEKNGQIE